MTPRLTITDGASRRAYTNIMDNPSVEVTEGNFTSVSGTHWRTRERSTSGDWCLGMSQDDAVDDRMVSYNLTITNAGSYFVSCDVYLDPSTWDAGAVSLELSTGSTGMTITHPSTTQVNTGEWKRISLGFTTSDPPDTSIGFNIICASPTGNQGLMWADSFQLVESEYELPYIDGDQPHAYWNGAPHASTSTQDEFIGTSVSLILGNLAEWRSKGGVFFLKDVRPQASQYADGGIYRSSPLVDGRRLVDTRYDWPVETYEIAVSGHNHDGAIRAMQNLRRLLVKAAQYWTTEWQTDPVWIEAKSDKETNTRYALIVNGQIAEDGNPWATPFVGPSIMDELNLVIERTHWLASMPGIGTPVALSAVQPYTIHDLQFVPESSTDDAWSDTNNLTIDLVNHLELGHDGQAFPNIEAAVGIRFRGVTVSQGETIKSARLYVTASGNYSPIANTTVTAEDVDSPAVFSTAVDFLSRLFTSSTSASVAWNMTFSWVLNQEYVSTELKTVIQEVIDRPGWTAGNDLVLFINTDSGSASYLARAFYSYDTGSGAGREPRLVIEIA